MARVDDHGNTILLPHGIDTDPDYIIQSHSCPGTYNNSISRVYTKH